MTKAEDPPKPTKNGRRKGPWSQAEIERLRRSYGLKPDAQIARDLHRSVESVRRIAKQVFRGDMRGGPWSPNEIQELKKYLGAAETAKISQILRRESKDIDLKIQELRSERKNGPWSSRDVQTLKRLYGNRSNDDLQMILGRSEADIEGKSAELCLAKDKGFLRRSGNKETTRMPRWSAEEKALLGEMYSQYPNLEIAQKLGRTVKSVVSKAHDMGLKKGKRRLQEMGRENVRSRYERAEPETSMVEEAAPNPMSPPRPDLLRTEAEHELNQESD